MKHVVKTLSLFVSMTMVMQAPAQRSGIDTVEAVTPARHLFLDVHQFVPGKIDPAAVEKAHSKDLLVEGKYDVDIMKYWLDKEKGMAFCLAAAPDSNSLRKTHAEAHGLLPSRIYEVTDGLEAAMNGRKKLFLDIHYLGAGKVTAADVAKAHEKDLAIQGRYGVNLVNYYFDSKAGVVMCLAEAKDEAALLKTHQEAHGLMPDRVFHVNQTR